MPAMSKAPTTGSQVVTGMERQKWLESAQAHLRKHFRARGYEVPDATRISIGWPVGSHGGKKAIGQCWAQEASADAHSEIFISPELGPELGASPLSQMEASILIVATLAHEDVHAVVGHEAGHKKPFRDAAVAIGLEGKMTATVPGDDFRAVAQELIAKIGTYPAGMLSRVMLKKTTTRLLKCECPDCGYVIRATRKWIEQSGPPVCPTDQVSFKCDDVDSEEGED